MPGVSKLVIFHVIHLTLDDIGHGITCNGGTKNSPIAVEWPTKKSVSDEMIESASVDMKY